MCGASDAVCLHGTCVVEAVDGAAYAHCRCDAMYSGSQCSFRGQLLYWELPVTIVLMLLLLGVGVLVIGKALMWLRFSPAKQDVFTFPRRWSALPERSIGTQLLRGKWSGPTRKGLPIKPAKRHLLENALIVIVAFLDLVPWIQLTALCFLPVVPWPKASRGVAELLRLSLLYPLWNHLEPSEFPRFMLYASLGFVPGMLLVACIIGVKRFPLFKPQPKSSPAEDLCTLVLRLYSEWLALPVMIGLLLPLECAVIGYTKAEGSVVMPPAMNASCFSLWQGGMAAAGSFMLLMFCITSSVITIQLNCEASPPEPTLWTHVRYTRVAHILKAPLAMSVVGSLNANALLLCGSCVLISLILGIMNAKLKPCVYSLVNGLRLAGAIMGLWSGLLALLATLIDDPGATMVYEVWSLGAIAISTFSLPGLLLYHTEDFWHRFATTGKTGSTSLTTSKGGEQTKRPDNALVVSAPAKPQTAKGAATRIGLPKIMPGRRSSAAEKLRSRSKRGQLGDAVETQ
ncbi:hypothetical protein KRP22_000880 [Phytophthora ramorum]|nr:hypothetical protein KRP22_383 [Phytophthora ramorum]